MNTRFRPLVSRGLRGSGSLAVACALVAASSPTAAQRARNPGASAAGEFPTACPRFVGQQLALGVRPHDVVLVDLDGDGDLDLALANRYPGSISTVPSGATSGDLNGDGDADLAVTVQGAVEVHFNRCR